MRHEHFEEIPSTQDYLNSLNPSEEYLISTNRQVQGKGRHGRKWLDQKGGLALSFTLKPSEVLTHTSLEIAVLIHRFFHNFGGLKWPNDLFDRHNKKWGGILIDSKNEWLVVGIGLNLKENSEFGFFPFPKDINPKELSKEVYQYILENRLTSEEILSTWESHCCHKDIKVQIDEDTGIFVGLGELGEAILNQDGIIKKFYSGSLLF